MKNLSFLVLIFLAFVSCNKFNQERRTEVKEVTDITYQSAVINYEVQLFKGDDVDAGICYANHSNPEFIITSNMNQQEGVEYDHGYIHSISSKKRKPMNRTYKIENLYAGQNYYVRSFIKLNKDEIIYSDEYVFNTLDIPSPPCSVNPGVVDFGFFSTSNNTDIKGGGKTLYCNNEQGRFNFTFGYPVKGGIYKTMPYATTLKEKEVQVSYTFTTNLTYNEYKAVSNSDIYVSIIDGDTSISFCDVKFTYNDIFNGTSEMFVTGKIVNQ